MDYEGFFKQRLEALRAEGRYRVFADLEQRCRRCPRAFDHRIVAEVAASDGTTTPPDLNTDLGRPFSQLLSHAPRRPHRQLPTPARTG